MSAIGGKAVAACYVFLANDYIAAGTSDLQLAAQSVVRKPRKPERGPCCSVADGQSVEDVDWDTKDGKYRVRLDGQWIEVPPDALVTAPNKFGLAVVWLYKDYEGRTQIRCFIPGAGG